MARPTGRARTLRLSAKTVRAFGAVLLTLLAVAEPRAAGTPVSGFSETPYATGLVNPTAIAFLPDGRLLVTEKGGALKVVEGGAARTLVTIGVCTDSEMGLLGIAVDPSFTTNGLIYLYRTENVNGCGSPVGRSNEVVRVTMAEDDTIDGASLQTLLGGIQTDGGNHDGGGLRIGPDEKLYVGVGDTGIGDQRPPGMATNPYAQDLAHLEGKLLRLDLDGSIPTDNPFVGQAGVRGEIFAYGFRNPFRFGFDPQTGKLWVADVGDLTVEEVDIVPAGGNGSWPYCEGAEPVGCAKAGDVLPVLTYRHDAQPFIGTSITGGAFGAAGFGSFEGHYFFGDYTGSRLYRVEPAPARDGVVPGTLATFVTGAAGPVDVVFGPDGALYYVAIGVGEVRRVAPLPTTSTSTSSSSSTVTTTSTSASSSSTLPPTTSSSSTSSSTAPPATTSSTSTSSSTSSVTTSSSSSTAPPTTSSSSTSSSTAPPATTSSTSTSSTAPPTSTSSSSSSSTAPPPTTSSSTSSTTSSSTPAPTTTTTTTISGSGPTTTSIPPACSPGSDPAGVACALTELRQALAAPPQPLCVRKCNCTIDPALARAERLLNDARGAATRRRCAIKLAAFKEAAAAIGRKVERVSRRGCLVPAERGPRAAALARTLARGAKALTKDATCPRT